MPCKRGSVTYVQGLLLLWLLDASEAVLCVQCNSRQDRNPMKCQKNPPPPGACHSSSSQSEYCVVVREMDKDGNILGFVRDCANMDINECQTTGLESPKPHEVCYKTCDQDGCNGATASGTPSSVVTVASLCALASVLLIYSGTD